MIAETKMMLMLDIVRLQYFLMGLMVCLDAHHVLVDGLGEGKQF